MRCQRIIFLVLLLNLGFGFTMLGQTGIGTVTPSHPLHVVPSSGDPVRIEGLQAHVPTSDSMVVVVNPATGILRTYPLESLVNSIGGASPWFVRNTTSPSSSNTDDIFISGDVGIGTSLPNHALEVNGRVYATNFTMTNGAAAGRILQSDASGNASWVAPGTVFTDTDTDEQDLSLTGSTLNITNGTGVNLSSFLDNTDNQTLGLASNVLSISGGNSVNLSTYLDDQTLSWASGTNTLTIADGNSVDLSSLAVGDNLGNHTATQNVRLSGNWLSGDGGNEGIQINAAGEVGVNRAPIAGARLSIDGADDVPALRIGGEDNIWFDNGQVRFTTHDGTGNFLIKTGADNDDVKIGSSSGAVKMRFDENGQFRIENQSGLTNGDAISWNTPFFIHDQGRIGINTTTPSASSQLDVNGRIQTTDFRMPTGAINGYLLQSDAVGNASWVAPGTVFTDTDDQTLSWASGTNTLTIADGNSVDLSSLAVGDNLGNHTAITNVQLNGNWLSGDGGSEGIFVNSAGDVGVGTGTPSNRLHVGAGYANVDIGYGFIAENNLNRGLFFNNTAYAGSTVLRAQSALFYSADANDTNPDTGTNYDGAFIWGINGREPGSGNWEEKMRLAPNGNLGIGAIVPIARLTLEQDHGASVEGNMIDFHSASGGINNGHSLQFRNGVAGYYAAIAALDDGNTDGRIEFRVSNDGIETPSQLTSADAAMVIKQTGNVGIGTTTPSSRLQVNGRTHTTDFTMTNGAATGRILQSDASGNASWVAPGTVFTDTDDQTLSWASGTNTLTIADGNSVDLSSLAVGDNLGNHTATQTINTGSNWISANTVGQGVRVLNNGLTNIRGTRSVDFYQPTLLLENTNSNPAVLQIKGGGSGNDYLTFYVDNAVPDQGASYIITGDNLDDPLHFGRKLVTSGNMYDAIDVTFREGRVGIGTTNPSEQFQLNDKFIMRSTSWDILGSNYHWNGTGSEYIVDGEAGFLAFEDDGDVQIATAPTGIAGNSSTFTTQLMVKNGGNVGIGTTSPTDRLHVNGRTRTNQFMMTSGAALGRILRSDATGNATWVDPSTVFVDSDNQNIQNLTFSGTTLTVGIENGSSQTVSLAALADNQSIQNSSFSGTTLTIGIEGGSSQTVSLAALADNQSIRNLGLSGTTLTVGIEDGSSQTVSLASLRDNLGNHRLTQNLQTRGSWISTFGGAEGIFVESGGNVGIGINDPTADLHVVGTALVSNMPTRTNDAFVITSDAIGNLRKVSWADASSAFGDDLGDHILDQNLVLGNRYISGDGDNEGLRVNSSGQVYIGISPTAPFTVRATGDNNPSNNSIHAVNPDHGVGNEDAIISARTTYADGGDPIFAMGILGAGSWSMGVDNSDDDKFKISNSYSNIASNTHMTIQQNGYVGIGVETTFAPLTIDGNNWNVRFGENTVTPVQIYRTSMGNGGRAELNFGKRGSANDAGCVRYMHQGDNNLQNRVEIGVFNNHDVLVANAAGNVGINESYPEGKFHIKEDIGTPASSTTGTLILEHLDNGGESSIVFFSRANASDYAYISYKDDGSGNGTSTENGLLTIGVENDGVGSSAQDDIALLASGNVGIGTKTPSQALHVVGNIFSTGTVTSSDSTLKTNIERYDADALTQIKHLNAVTYNWKASVQESGGYSSGSQIGFLAQEVQEVIPEAVLGKEGTGMGIDFNKVTPVIVKAMQEQQDIIEQQQVAIETQEQRIQQLELALQQIEARLEK